MCGTRMNTGSKDPKGRAILAGPRGGLFVLGADGKKVRVAKTAGDAASAAKAWKRRVQARLRRPPGGKKGAVGWVKVPAIRFDTASWKRTVADRAVNMNVMNASPGALGNRVRSGDVVATRWANVSDEAWFRAQADYVYGLSDDDLLTVMGYTVRSGMWIGPYQRAGVLPTDRTSFMLHGSHIAGLYPQLRDVTRQVGFQDAVKPEFWPAPHTYQFVLGVPDPPTYDAYVWLLAHAAFTDRALDLALARYERDLKRIIAAAPPVRRPMVLYRGTDTDTFAGHVGRTYTSKAFSSAAFHVGPALAYSRDPASRLQRLTLLPGTRALLLATVNQWDAAGENEVVINAGARYRFTSRDAKRWVVHHAKPGRYSLLQRAVTDVEVGAL